MHLVGFIIRIVHAVFIAFLSCILLAVWSMAGCAWILLHRNITRHGSKNVKCRNVSYKNVFHSHVFCWHYFYCHYYILVHWLCSAWFVILLSFILLYIYIYIYIYIHICSGFSGLGVACWPLVPKLAGSNPAEAVGFLGRKNPQHAFLRREIKPSVPCRRFAACKRSLDLRGSRNLGKITGQFLAHSSTFRC